MATYRQEWIKCGRPTCSTCRFGEGHGPYWYAYWRARVDAKSVAELGRWKSDKLSKMYVGKVLPPEYGREGKGMPPPNAERHAPTAKARRAIARSRVAPPKRTEAEREVARDAKRTARRAAYRGKGSRSALSAAESMLAEYPPRTTASRREADLALLAAARARMLAAYPDPAPPASAKRRRRRR